MDWIILAFFMALVNASIALTMQKTNKSGDLLVFWRGLIPAIALTPFILTGAVAFPTEPLFYIATVATSLIVIYTDKIKLTAPQRFGAGAYTRLMPIAVWATFFVWFAIDSGHREELLQNPQEFVLMLLALSVGFWGIRRLKEKCETSMKTLFYVSPAILLSTAVAVLNKTAMDHSMFWQGIIVYAWIQALLIPSVKVALNARNGVKMPEYFSRDILMVGVWIGFLFLSLNMFKNMAITLAPNPAYVLLIGFSQPIIVMFVNKLTGHKDETDKVGGFAILGSVVLLVVGTKL